jgi:ParB family chromosome partitioning protein
VDLARESVARGFTVRDVERKVREGSGRTPPSKRATAGKESGRGAKNAEARHIEDLLRKKLQTDVSLALEGKEKGEIRIAFYSNDDLERVLEVLGIRLDL